MSQKVLKLMEEAGELAKAALPYDSAFCTNHRFVTPLKILEEAVDTMLVALSVAYSLGFDDDDIAGFMKLKSDYWAELQARDSKLTDKTPYELHVTVSNVKNVEEFKQVCSALEVKPLLLDLQTRGEGVIKDLMTSSVFMGRNSEALAEVERIADGLAAAGFSVVRKKIETVPWHPAAPSRTHAKPSMPEGCYFECHFGISTDGSPESFAALSALAIKEGCHLSKNVFKRKQDGTVVVMATYRTYDGLYEEVQEQVAATRAALHAAGYFVDREIIEFSIYDTRISHDASWLKA
ncbi:hypothetical protein LC612_36295 [Nostoc sp. CHAB 5834]|nr:hypothetical protein [Nostoc sp. CHAB 5834]